MGAVLPTPGPHYFSLRRNFFINLFADPFHRIPLLLGSLVLSAAIVGILILQYVQSAFIERAGHMVELAAADTADKLDRLMFERFGDIEMMAHTFASEANNPAYISTYLSRMRHAYPLYRWLAVTDAEGKIIASTDAIWVAQYRTTTSWFQAVKSKHGFVVQDAQPYAELGGLQAVSFSAPMIDADGSFRGVVTSLVTLPALADVLQQAQQVFRMQVAPHAQPDYIVVAKNGEIIIDFLAPGHRTATLSAADSVSRLAASDSPGYVEESIAPGDREVITGYAGTKGYGEFTGLSWGVLVRVNRGDVLAPIAKIIGKIALAGLAIVLPALTLLFWTSVRLQREDVKLRESEEALRTVQLELEQRVQERTEELEAKQAQLIQTAKLASLGELASGIAHELNNPLNNIGLSAGNAEEYLASGHCDFEALRTNLNQIQQQVQRAASIINHIRAFARTAPRAHEEVSINEVLRQSVALIVEPLRLHDITIVLNLEETNPVVQGNKIQLEQVFVNLLTNARDAMQGAATRLITITTHMVGDMVRVEVADTGAGIPAAVLPRIFDPFFTTKPVGRGTGLGLSITYGIVKEHQGTIEVHSSEDGGSTFVIHLPVTTKRNRSGAGSGKGSRREVVPN